MVAAGFRKPIQSGDETHAADAPADIEAFIDRLLVGSALMRQARHDDCNIPQAARRLGNLKPVGRELSDIRQDGILAHV